ncbi:MAG: hypothetical protein D6706_03745 [Chloroflexi bacterium]|nr:MAG: hypothetical protein D6706_03745 [Chloroflexota bacterium]
MDEKAFLANIQKRLASRSEKPAHPGQFGRPVRTLPDDLAAEFHTRLTAVGGHVYLVHTLSQAADQVQMLLDNWQVQRAAISGHAILHKVGVLALLQERGIAMRVETAESPSTRNLFSLADAEVGITGAEYVVAASGTLVMAASTWHTRSVSLVPPRHVALVRQSQLLPDLAALSAQLQKDFGAAMPSGLVLISGPSKTADIEQTLTIGVHGPGELHVILINE